MGTIIGKGEAAFGQGRIRGAVRRFTTPDDVLDVIGDDLTETIALVESGGTTFLAPILGRLGGVMCMSGTLRSHLAIVSREYQLPCLMAVEFTEPVETGDHVVMVVDLEGGQGAVEREETA
jgi:phosphohistidine swiveling domain-containing protein